MSDLPGLPAALPLTVADSHCHLDLVADKTGLDERDILQLAQQAGIDRVVQISVDIDSSQQSVKLASQLPRVVAAVAIHPNDTGVGAATPPALAILDELATHERVRAIGETGLDYFRTDASGHALQQESFRAHIEIARRHNKAVVIHDRDAHDDVLSILAESQLPDVVIFHCFSGDTDFARRCVAAGYYLSFAGNVTFKNAHSLRDAAQVVPNELLLVETDAPFLTPVPYRGKFNAPHLIPHTMACLSQVRNVDLEQLCSFVSANSDRAFGEF